MSKISIIIPHHQESANFIYPLLASIDIQIGVNWDDVEVLIINDDMDHVITDFSRYQNIKPKNLYNKHKPGLMGISRQIGIDAAKGDYVIFCDSDDMLHSSTVLAGFFMKINETDNPFDILINNFLEEAFTSNTKERFYSLHKQDYTWMFGKVYRRDFLVRNAIRFHPELRIHEDSYFNCLFRAYRPRVRYSEECSYIWKYNEKSITRKDDAEYSYNSITIFIDAIEKSILEIQNRNIANITDNVIQLLVYIYTLLQTKNWNSERTAKYKPDIEMRLAETITKFFDYLQSVDENLFYRYLQQEYNNQVGKSGPFMISETWPQFVERIMKNYNEKIKSENPEEKENETQEV